MKKILNILIAVSLTVPAMAQQKVSIEVLGHRGGRYEFEENTLSAFEGAYKKGVRSFETDVRISADNELVIQHDASLKRISGTDLVIEESTRGQIAKIVTREGNPILFADQLAKFFSTRDIHYIEWEMKTTKYSEDKLDSYCSKLYETVMPSKPKGAVYVFSSFDKRAILTMKRLHPEAECMFITNKPMSKSLIEEVTDMGFRRVACKIDGTSRADVQEAHKAGLTVNLYPGKTLNDFQLAVALGADISCLDVPVAALKLVKKSMKWVSPHKELK